MWKLTALLTMLAAGTSASVAMASPSPSFDGRGRLRPTRIDHQPLDRGWQGSTGRGARDDFGPRHYRPTWVPLSSSLQLARTGRSLIEVNDRNTFTQLRLQTASGAARIDRVIVQFADGSDQIANLGRVLDDPDELLEIALDGNNRRIDRIAVIGAGDGRGAVQVFGI